MNGSSCNAQYAGVNGDEEVNVIDCAIGSLHIDTGEIFVSAEVRPLIIMDFDQIKRDLFATRSDVKLLVGRFLGVRVDILSNAAKDLRVGNYQALRGALGVLCCCPGQWLRLGLLRSPWMLLRKEQQAGR